MPCLALRCEARAALLPLVAVACRREGWPPQGNRPLVRVVEDYEARGQEARTEEPEEDEEAKRGGQRKQKAEGREVEVEGDTVLYLSQTTEAHMTQQTPQSTRKSERPPFFGFNNRPRAWYSSS